MMKEESGLSSVRLEKKLRIEINDLKLTLPYLIEIGLKAHKGDFLDEKTFKLVQKLSEESQKRVAAEEALRKFKKENGFYDGKGKSNS